MQEVLLIDTQILIWMALAPEKLSLAAQKNITNPNTSLQLSYASIWEMAIKIKTGKLDIVFP
jgi:PIN domain nuclease of toxin-antitoxin system